MRVFLVVLIVAMVIVHGFFRSEFAVDAGTVSLMVILLVVVLVPHLKSASLPWGGNLIFRDNLANLANVSQEIRDVPPHRTEDSGGPYRTDGDDSEGGIGTPQDGEPDPGGDGGQGGSSAISQETAITPNSEGFAEEVQFSGRQPAPTSFDRSTDEVVTEILGQAALSPRVGLLLLSAELDRAVREALVEMGLATPQLLRSTRMGVGRLVEAGALYSDVAEALGLFTSVRNQIVHGHLRVSDSDVFSAIESGIPILTSVMSVPRERYRVERVRVELFADSRGEDPRNDVEGIVLAVTTPGNLTPHYRIYPTTKRDYVVGERVGWEWNDKKSWGPTWYENDFGAEPFLAWSSSVEFVGRQLSDI